MKRWEKLSIEDVLQQTKEIINQLASGIMDELELEDAMMYLKDSIKTCVKGMQETHEF